jgi:hypothetical protein
MDVETISSFTTHLFQVKQLIYKPAHIIRAPILISAQVEYKPGRYNQDMSRADQYRVILNKRGPLLFPLPTQQQQEEETTPPHRENKTPPTGSEEEQTIVKTCRPNSKETPLADVFLFVFLSRFSLHTSIKLFASV